MKQFILLVIMALCLSPCLISADTIYSWKDKDGNLKFSNEPPPEGITVYQTTESPPTDSNNQNSNNKRRPSYDKMVEQSIKDANASSAKRKKEALARDAAKKKAMEAERKERMLAERKRIEQQIQAIKNRAVSPTYSNGMKQAQIEELEKKIQKLEKDSKPPGKETEKFSNRY